MKISEIHNLLNQADQLFVRRNLGDAKHMANKALEFATEQTDALGMLQSNLLLGEIYTVEGRFAGDITHFTTAKKYIQKAEQCDPAASKNGWEVKISLAYSELYQQEKGYDQALKSAQQALKASQRNGDTVGSILTYCALSRLLVLKNELQEAEAYANQALELLDEKMDEHCKVEVYHHLCQIYIKRQEYAKVLEYSEYVLEVSRRYEDVEKELSAQNNIAIYYGIKKDYKTAMQYFLEALAKSKSINYRRQTAQSQINIATIYASLLNYKEAVSRYENVLKEYAEVLDTSRVAIVYNNLGNIFYLSDDTEKAISYFAKAYELARSINYREMIALSLAQQSRAVAALHQFDKALAMAQEAQSLIDELGEINGKPINLINLGNIYFNRRDFDRAIRLTSQGIVAAKRMKDDEHEVRGYQALAKIYKELGDFERALSYQMIYSKTQEGFSKIQRSRQILDLEIQHAILEKQKEIEQLTRENEYQSLLLEQSDRIAHQNAQLLQANEELRQFAYVASHDLKEPLRMIGSYTQLIHRRFKERSDDETKPYFEFVSEGVTRMNNLLDALLKYATIGKTEEEKEMVRLVDAVDIAIINLRVSIEETHATIECSNLPEVYSVQSLLVQLFQNLISNAIKFRQSEIYPHVHIACEENAEEHIIKVKDNGIGIDPEFRDRIFVIFQRLHTRTQYDGTGIGLAICQKIIQRLSGRIWVESIVGEGATFCFTIPKRKI